MALNKYMHPRNLYKTPPDFSKLAKSFAEFSMIAKTDVTGKVTINFKDPHCLRVLTKCLLKADFGLDVVIPDDRLVPTLPLRLNYILWIEDLLDSIHKTENIKGLDIGTGACAIYPLLAVTKNKWHMMGTETDQESFEKAQENITRNNLQDFIELNKNSTSTLLEYLFTEDNSRNFHFCMCNPPFYSNVQELCESRSPARLPPKNGFTGSPQELITDGGELTFCRKLIKESKIYKDKVLIFSTMVGHKYNMKELAQDLKTDGINHTTTEFCQGRVTRWGLAWTYQKFPIDKLVPGRDKLRKKNLPIVHILPELNDPPCNFETVCTKLIDILKVLNIKYKLLDKKGNQLCLDVIAIENTWSNQRRKRRKMKMRLGDPKKSKLNEGINCGDGKTSAFITTKDEDLQTKLCEYNKEHNANNNEITCVHVVKNDVDNVAAEPFRQTVKSINSSTESIISLNDSENSVIPECSVINSSANAEPLVHAIFKLVRKDNDTIIEVEFLDGTSGKEGVHQILQYIKNNWK